MGTVTVRADTAAALVGDTSWRVDGGVAWVRVCSEPGCAGWSPAGAAVADAAGAASDAGASGAPGAAEKRESVTWRPVCVPGRVGARTGSVSSVLADAVDAPED